MSSEGMETGEAGPSAHLDPTECLKLKPKRSILKSGSSFDAAGLSAASDAADAPPSAREAHFDPDNLLETLHPADKDYGHMKIDEPKTPYNAYSDSEGEAEGRETRPRRVSLTEGAVDASALRQRLGAAEGHGPTVLEPGAAEPDESPEERQRRMSFEAKRKSHYNEASRMAEAKAMIAQELKDLED